MATTSKTEQIFIHRDGQKIELQGLEKEAYLLQQELDIAEQNAIKTAETARQTKLNSAITKLKALGLTESEAKIIIGLE